MSQSPTLATGNQQLSPNAPATGDRCDSHLCLKSNLTVLAGATLLDLHQGGIPRKIALDARMAWAGAQRQSDPISPDS